MSETTLNIRVVGSKLNDGNFQLRGIPTEVWDKFREEAETLMPDKGENAWSEILVSVILSLLKSKERVILMNEIPDYVYDSAENVCREANSTLQELLKEVLESASEDNFYLGVVKQTEVEETTATLVFTGVPLPTIEMFNAVSQFYAKQEKIDNFGGIDFLTKLFAQNSNNLHFATATTESIANSHTIVISNIPKESIEYWQTIADNFKTAYKEASKEEINATAVTMIATMLLQSGKGQVAVNSEVKSNE